MVAFGCPPRRIKHWYGENSLQAYDKAYSMVGSTLRAEMTMQNPEEFKVYRHPEGHQRVLSDGTDYAKGSPICTAGRRFVRRPMNDI
jgi:hypothetical protein